jgi:hypothetical protein
MDFLNHREGKIVFYQVFLLSLLQCTVTELKKYVRSCVSVKKYERGCVSLKKLKSQGKSVEVTLNSKEENSQDFCLDFVQEFSLRTPWTERKRVSIWYSRDSPRTGEGVEGVGVSQIVRYINITCIILSWLFLQFPLLPLLGFVGATRTLFNTLNRALRAPSAPPSFAALKAP